MEYRFKKIRHSVDEYVDGILNKDRIMLSKAITLVESKLCSDNDVAELVLEKIIPYTGNSLRLGITGVPGAGKSTFIETFGKYLITLNKKVAVLTIDPSSYKTKGSILGDKTRMEELSNDPAAYVRPSSSGLHLGGVHSKTRETMLLCEASGYDVVIIETVGVGQSEVGVKGIVDFFLLLLLAGAGDELQGIKRGIMEMADAVIINKADGDNIKKSMIARRQFQNALNMFAANENGWKPEVLTASAMEGNGIKETWSVIRRHEEFTKLNGSFERNRRGQNLQWMHDVINAQLKSDFYNDPVVVQQLADLEGRVEAGNFPAITAARQLMERYKGKS